MIGSKLRGASGIAPHTQLVDLAGKAGARAICIADLERARAAGHGAGKIRGRYISQARGGVISIQRDRAVGPVREREHCGNMHPAFGRGDVAVQCGGLRRVVSRAVGHGQVTAGNQFELQVVGRARYVVLTHDDTGISRRVDPGFDRGAVGQHRAERHSHHIRVGQFQHAVA